MFTGIVEEMGTVSAVADVPGLRRITVYAPTAASDLKIGDSVAVNGVCLTAVGVEIDTFQVEIVPETLRRSNLDGLVEGNRINLELSMPATGRFGGHLVQGHVDTGVRLVAREPDGEAQLLTFSGPAEYLRYVVPKGFVALDGVSLTVIDGTPRSFCVTLIPHTLAATTLGAAKPGYVANLEVDILAKYVERLIHPSPAIESDISMTTLRSAGFVMGAT